MNVCFVSQAFVRRPADPIGSFIFRLAEDLADHGVSLTAVVPRAAGLADRETIGRTKVVRFR